MFAKVWDWTKRAFGRSRTIAINVFGALSVLFIENSDTLMNIDWNEYIKHDVAIVVALGVHVLNVLLRLDTVAPVSFAPLQPMQPVGDPVEVAPVNPAVIAPSIIIPSDVPPSPKAV